METENFNFKKRDKIFFLKRIDTLCPEVHEGIVVSTEIKECRNGYSYQSVRILDDEGDRIVCDPSLNLFHRKEDADKACNRRNQQNKFLITSVAKDVLKEIYDAL